MGFFGEFINMVNGMARGDYFDFVTKDRIGDEIPVFTYHRVDKGTFERHLDHLKKNGYQTLNSVQLYEAMQSSKIPEKAVMLTFDDGLEDLYSVVFPILRSYGMQVVVFIAPYWVGSDGVVDWPQIEEMDRSGLVDFQAHSYTHGRIPVSPKIVNFFHPRFSYHQAWEIARIGNGDEENRRELPEWGTPVYFSESCLSDRKRFFVDDDLTNQCVDFVKIHGGDSFFRNIRWKKKLRYVVRTYRANNVDEDVYETEEQQAARIRREVELSKSIIEKKLPGKEVTAFAYPFYEHGKMVAEMLKEYGYRLIFGGLNKDVPMAEDSTCFFLRRVTGDFVMRLPGEGRSSLARILLTKARRKLRKVSVY